MDPNIPKNPYLETAKHFSSRKALNSIVDVTSNMQNLINMQRSLDAIKPDMFDDLSSGFMDVMHKKLRSQIDQTGLKFSALTESLDMNQLARKSKKKE